jgi:hypothetical protein
MKFVKPDKLLGDSNAENAEISAENTIRMRFLCGSSAISAFLR